MSAEGATQDRTGDWRDGKIRRTTNARRDGKLDGQTGASGELRATKRENGTGGGGWKCRADGAQRNGKTVRTRRKARVGDGKPQARRRKDQC